MCKCNLHENLLPYQQDPFDGTLEQDDPTGTTTSYLQNGPKTNYTC